MLRFVTIFLSYVIAGKLALLLAVAPGYATAVFPSAGIALAAALVYPRISLPAIWLGSFVLNAWATYDNAQQLDVIAFVLPAVVGLGAMLQAWVGATLIRRFVGYPAMLDDLDSILGFFLLGGPIACLINAATANVFLAYAGIIEWDAWHGSALVWWIGDTIGVLVAAPWVLSLIGEPQPLWRKRRVGVMLPSLVTLTAVTVLFFRASGWENDRIQFSIYQRADAAANRLTGDLLGHMEALQAVKGFFAASETVEADEFKKFVEPILQAHPDMAALEWVPRVENARRGLFEERARKIDGQPFVIRERDATGQLTRSAEQSDYYPVVYVEPRTSNEPARGFDLGSERVRREAMEHARARHIPTATRPIPLVQYTPDNLGFLVFLPTRGRDITSDMVVDGFAVGVFKLDTLISQALGRQDRRDFHVRVSERERPDHAWLALPAQGRLSTTRAEQYHTSIPFDLAGIPMQIEFTPVAGYINELRPWQAWITLAGGLLFTGLLGAFLLYATGQTARVATLVDERTRDLNRAVGALSENEARLQAVLDNAGDGIVTLDHSGAIMSANRIATRILGRSSTELIGLPLARSLSATGQHLLTEYIADHHRTATNASNTATKITDVAQYGDGNIPVMLTISEVPLPSGRQFTVIMHDITEQRRIDELKNEFVATVSHELRTPLTSIRGSLGLILGGAFGAVPDALRRMIDLAVQNADRLTLLVNDILDIEKIEAGTMAFNIHPLPLRPLIHHAIDINSGYAKTFGVEVEFVRGHGNDDTASVDPDRYTQVLTNLLSNAIKFSPRGSTVEVALERKNDWLEVSVRDRGPGIAEDFRSRIFTKFAQADSSSTRRHSGTGLGLNISKAIMDRLNGEIDFESAPGEGTVFYARLPVVRDNG